MGHTFLTVEKDINHFQEFPVPWANVKIEWSKNPRQDLLLTRKSISREK